jgi:hypothetical protein
VDDYLRQGMNAFLSKDYRGALMIFRFLLIPISEGEIDLGQHEMLDEVLGMDLADCAAQYVVAQYMISVPAQRAEAVKAAIDDMSAVATMGMPRRWLQHASPSMYPKPQWNGWQRFAISIAVSRRSSVNSTNAGASDDKKTSENARKDPA